MSLRETIVKTRKIIEFDVGEGMYGDWNNFNDTIIPTYRIISLYHIEIHKDQTATISIEVEWEDPEESM